MRNIHSVVKQYKGEINAPIVSQWSRTPGDTTGYIKRHVSAFASPMPGMEFAIVNGIKALAHLAAGHEASGTKIADDYFGRDHFADMCRGLRAMLNFECGPRLDMGFCDAAILNIYRLAGFTEEL